MTGDCLPPGGWIGGHLGEADGVGEKEAETDDYHIFGALELFSALEDSLVERIKGIQRGLDRWSRAEVSENGK